MVVLDFQFDARVLAEDRNGDDLRTVDPAVLLLSYFAMPVRLTVGDVDLFQRPTTAEQTWDKQEQVWVYDPAFQTLLSQQVTRRHHRAREVASPWLSLPPLHLATVGLEMVQKAGKHGTACYCPEGGGCLDIAVRDSRAEVYSTMNTCHTQAPYVELLEAFASFRRTVQRSLGEACPELKEHPAWGRWFKGEVRLD